MKKILCPIDFGDASINAIDYAANIAKRTGASLTLLNVLPVTAVTVDDPSFTDAYIHKKQENKQRLEKMVKETISSFGIECDYRVDKSEVEDDIPEVVNKENYDLVVMGTDGATSLFEYYTGSNTSKTVEKTDCPVLAIPFDFLYADIKKIVYATNYREGEDIYIKQLLDFARPFDADVAILHVSHKDTPVSKDVFTSFKNNIEEEFPEENNLHFERIIYDDVADGLEKYLSQNNVDILGLLTRHRNFFQKMFHTSITKKMALFSDYPVLVFHK